MRELAKSVNSFSWAMSLMGAQQVARLMGRPSRGPGAPPFADPLPATPVGVQLEGVWKRTFDAGDLVQRSAVDLLFGLITMDALRPSRLAALSSDLLQHSTAALRGLLPGVGAAPPPAACGESRPCGWGPMPPAR